MAIRAPLEGAIQAIAELRREGFEPDAVLLPRDPHVRALLGREEHPQWKWTANFLQQSPQLAALSDVPVYDPGPADATLMIVCRLGASVRKLERRPAGSHAVRADVELINDARARTLFDAGRRAAGVPADRDTQVAAIRDGYIEVHVEMNVRWERPEEGPRAWRIELPAVDARKRRS